MRIKRPSRRVIAISMIILLPLIGGLYAWQSISAWKGLEARMQSNQKELETLKETALHGDNQEKRLEAVRKLDDKVAQRGDFCDVSPLYNWQASVLPMIKDGLERCESAVKQLDALARPLSELRDYLDVGVKIQSSLKKLQPAGALTEKNWQKLGVERARAVQKEINDLKVAGDAAALRKQASTLAGNLVTSWEDLLKANQKKDKIAFISSSLSVANAYAEFGSLADTSDAIIQQKIREITEAARSITEA